MAVNVIKDIYKYKQAAYYGKPSKQYRTTIQRVLRHNDKIEINRGDYNG